MSSRKERDAASQLNSTAERITMRDLIFLTCIMVLSATLIYASNTMVSFHRAAIQVYCEKRADFDKCSQEFREKTSELMRQK